MAKKKKQSEVKIEHVGLDELYLDPNNYRLIHEPEYVNVLENSVKERQAQRRTLKLLAKDKNQDLRDLLESFKANGYLPVDQIQVRPLKDGGYLVVEGNRRVAALKHLQSEYNQKNIELGQLDSSVFTNVPIVHYTDSDELHHLTLMGLKHISGNKKWGEWNQAMLLEKMLSTYKLPEDDICQRLGISRTELRRSSRALSFLQQYRDSDYGERFTESQFPIFREAIRSIDLKAWLGWNEDERKALNSKNRELFFSWISRVPSEEDDDENSSSYGDKYLDPALVKRDDIRLLGKIINDEKAIAQLKLTRDINAAYRSSDQIFRERQEAAVKSVGNEIETLSKLVIEANSLPDLEASLGRLQGIVDRAKASGLSGVEQKTVFHDRIDRHFSELTLSNYKRLQNLKISNLSRINLFAGINNSGKTTLLEAIYLLSRQNDFSGLLEVIRRRGKISEDQMNPEWFIERLPLEIEISGIFDKTPTTVRVTHYEEQNGGIDRSSYIRSVEISSKYGDTKQESLTQIFKGQKRKTQADGIKILCPSVFSSPFFLNEPHRYAPFYHKSTQSKALPEIFRFIREQVVDTIDDIRLVDELQRFLVSDTQYDYALDLMEYGEGLQRIFFISLLFAYAQNGIVLIDEFENAIHTELISNFAQLIYDLSKTFNTQVFLTTHSKECIDAFVRNIPEADDLSVCALVEAEEKIVAREFTGRKFKRLVEAGNVDLRRAK